MADRSSGRKKAVHELVHVLAPKGPASPPMPDIASSCTLCRGTATSVSSHRDPTAAVVRSFPSPFYDRRAARSRLSFETFNAFLASIKRLNNQQQDREETLRTAERLFGESPF